LHMAILLKQHDLVKLLLEKGASISVVDEEGLSLQNYILSEDGGSQMTALLTERAQPQIQNR